MSYYKNTFKTWQQFFPLHSSIFIEYTKSPNKYLLKAFYPWLTMLALAFQGQHSADGRGCDRTFRDVGTGCILMRAHRTVRTRQRTSFPGITATNLSATSPLPFIFHNLLTREELEKNFQSDTSNHFTLSIPFFTNGFQMASRYPSAQVHFGL